MYICLMFILDGVEKGIILFIILEFFWRIEVCMGSDVNLLYMVEVFYIEIYNEKWVMLYVYLYDVV